MAIPEFLLRLAYSILLLAVLTSAPAAVAASATTQQQRSFDYPNAGLGTEWLNDERSSNNSVDFFDGSKVRTMLIKGSLGPRFACGFFCAGGASCSTTTTSSGSYFFGVFIVITDSASGIVMPAIGFPQLVWAANRGRPVSENATVELRKDGNLVLQDANGEPVWESGTSALGVTGMALLESGNLVLHGNNSSTPLWQSFDHPSDVMLPGQALRAGMKLVASTSTSDSTPGPYYLAMEERGLVLYASAATPQPYWKRTVEPATAGKSAYAQYTNGSISLFVNPPRPPGGNAMPDTSIELPAIQSAQYLRLSHDGRLLLFSWESKGWILQFDLLRSSSSSTNSKCNLPSACGRFGVCTDDGECSCPKSFAPLDVLRPSRGCLPRRPYQCHSKRQGFLELQGMDYFANDYSSGTRGLSLQQCKSSCQRDCSCRAVFYRNGERAPDKSAGGICYPVTEVYSLRNSYRGPGYTSVAYLKV